jgi:hypothetical protein
VTSRRAHAKPREVPRGTRRARGRRTRTIAIGVAGILVAAVAFGLWTRRIPLPGASSQFTAAPAPALDLPTPRAYLDAAVSANAAGDPRLLAIVDEGLARFPNDPLLSLARGAALNNLSFRVEYHRGRGVPRLATSLERVRAAQEAIAAYDGVARRYPAIPEPVGERGLVLITWGLPEDGRAELERAYAMGDRRPEILNALSVVDRTERAP